MAEDRQLYNSVAPLRNVAALVSLVERVKDRPVGLPGLGVFYGYSGFGKTTAAIYAANKFDALQVQVKSCWTGKKLCQAILQEMGVEPGKTIADMVDQIARDLSLTDRPLIVDEADYLVARRMIEIVRDIYESSGAPILLIGEESMPQKLQKWERVHGRVLDWVAAEPACLADVGHLAKIYCPLVGLDDMFKAALLRASRHSIRRVCVNLQSVSEFARTKGLTQIGVDTWGQREFFASEAPTPRRDIA